MTKKNRVAMVTAAGGDWQGLYIDGKLVAEDHRLDTGYVLGLIGVEFDEIEADDEWMGKVGKLPRLLTKVIKSNDSPD